MNFDSTGDAPVTSDLDDVDDAPAGSDVDPEQLSAYIGWLARQDPAQGYDYSDNRHCPGAKYFVSLGYRDVEVVPGEVRFEGGAMALPFWLDVIGCNGERTYGAALERAQAVARELGVPAD